MKPTTKAPVRVRFFKVTSVAIIYSVMVLFSQQLMAQSVAVTGVVKDNAGAAIPGAAVKLKNSKSGVSTDSLGKFSLPVKSGAVLDITAIGFDDTTVVVPEGQNAFTIILHQRQNNLQSVTVNSTTGGGGGNTMVVVDPVAFDQIVASTLGNYASAAGFSSGITTTSGINPVTRTSFHTITEGMGALNTVNSGEMLPYYMPKGETHGSRYLFPGYVGGVVIDSSNGIIENSTPIYNYDKIDGALLIRRDDAHNIEVNREQVKGFALKGSDATYVFMHVPAIGPSKYYVFLGAGAKYALFKGVKTKFIKSNYVSNGLIESGNNYDEYADENEYYLLSLREKQPTPVVVVLKKKAIKQVFAADAAKVDAYFGQHKDDDINEAFVKGLVEFIN